MMKNKIYEILSADFIAGSFIRIGENRNLSLYVGKDEEGRYAFDFRGIYKPVRIVSSDVILVSQLQNQQDYFLRFSLEDPSLLEYFCTFCEDLLTSTYVINDDNLAYKILKSRYYSWRQLFKPNHGILTEYEIMGLIGELLFLRDFLFQNKGCDASLDVWTGPEKTHKDFSFENTWYEVKTVAFGKESVHVSSMEQLDSQTDGYLVIYMLEKMSPSYNGLKLNSLVIEVINMLDSIQQREVFMAKLALYDFDFSPEYDNFVYELQRNYTYAVIQNFPRITRGMLSDSITKVQYEIEISDLEKFKVNIQ